MSITDDLLRNNEQYAEGFDLAGMAAAPSKKVAIVSCMDARINVYSILGLAEGDAHVIRNAGGVITDDEIRSISISQHELGTEEVMVIQHTACGLLSIRDEEFLDAREQSTGIRPEWSTEAFSDLEANVRESVAQLKANPFIPRKESIRGFVYDVETGKLREVS